MLYLQLILRNISLVPSYAFCHCLRFGSIYFQAVLRCQQASSHVRRSRPPAEGPGGSGTAWVTSQFLGLWFSPFQMAVSWLINGRRDTFLHSKNTGMSCWYLVNVTSIWVDWIGLLSRWYQPTYKLVTEFHGHPSKPKWLINGGY